MDKSYEGFTANTPHYGYILIGKHIGNNFYDFYVPPVSIIDVDYHTNIFRYSASELCLEGFLDLNIENGDFVDDIEICDYMGLDYKVPTKLYVGSPTGKKSKTTYENNWSTMETANMLRVKQADAQYHGFAFDNGLFADFMNGLPFNELNFLTKLEKLHKEKMFPDFIVVPDIIGGGRESLKFSVDFMPKLDFCPFPKYLVVQDGMTIEDVEPYLCRFNNDKHIEFDGIFVGGVPTFKGFGKKRSKKIEWKIKTMKSWTTLAHKYDKKCHIGRVSSIRRFDFARSIGANSGDTSIMNFKPSLFKTFKKAQKQGVFEF